MEDIAAPLVCAGNRSLRVFRLKYLRLERRISQRALAAQAKMSNVDLCRIESGRLNPTEQELTALATALGCAPERLMEKVEDGRG